LKVKGAYHETDYTAQIIAALKTEGSFLDDLYVAAKLIHAILSMTTNSLNYLLATLNINDIEQSETEHKYRVSLNRVSLC
jgi:hypothetical protein